MTLPLIALLGRKDHPTDAVEEYCNYLGKALYAHDFDLQIRRVPWDKRGWASSLAALHLMSASWRGKWILVQYTALAWSARGLPGKFLHVLNTIIKSGARVAVVFHDVEPFSGTRFADRFRRWVQVRTMRRAVRLADAAIFTVPLERVSWLTSMPANAHFIPVGPNLPLQSAPPKSRLAGEVPTIAVFSITGGQAGLDETRVIVAAVRFAAKQIGKLRLSVFGRNAESAETSLRESLTDVSVEISVEGVLEESQLVERFSAADVLLFVRGPVSSRRGSAIAGIACGLPVIAFPGSETAPPITDAGVVLVPPNNQDELSAALLKVLSDSAYRGELTARSRAAYEQYFSWPSIAHRFAAILK